MSSNDLVNPDTDTEAIVKRISNKGKESVLKAGSIHENIEIDERYLNEILEEKDL